MVGENRDGYLGELARLVGPVGATRWSPADAPYSVVAKRLSFLGRRAPVVASGWMCSAWPYHELKRSRHAR